MKVLIITGGSSGIGKAVAELFNSKGYRVYELSRSGVSHDGIEHITCDVTSPEDCQEAVSAVVAREGHIDVLISNSGTGISGAIEFADTCEIRRMMEVNFYGAVNICQAVIGHMRERRSGRIIFTSSLAAEFAIPFHAFYSASKAALNSMASALRNELLPFGIKVSCIEPGDVRTGFTACRRKNDKGIDIYPQMRRMVEGMERDEKNGIAPEKMARRIYHMAETRYLWLFYTLGWNYRFLTFLKHFVPATLSNHLVNMAYKE